MLSDDSVIAANSGLAWGDIPCPRNARGVARPPDAERRNPDLDPRLFRLDFLVHSFDKRIHRGPAPVVAAHLTTALLVFGPGVVVGKRNRLLVGVGFLVGIEIIVD